MDESSTTKNDVPEWGIGPFRRVPENPILGPVQESVFRCPVKNEIVHWESRNTVASAAAVRNNHVYLLYRAEPEAALNSRLGLARSADGVNYRRLPQPVLYPDNDAFTAYEWAGGTEDGRIVQREDGLFVLLYPAYDGQEPGAPGEGGAVTDGVARQCAATSWDLVFWEKHGPVFRDAHDGKYLNTWTKSGSIVSRYHEDGRVVAEKINGKYWGYFGDQVFFPAWSHDLLQWVPVQRPGASPGPEPGQPGKTGDLLDVLPVRGDGYFDGLLTEPGPPPVITDKGILVLYTGKNSPENGDPTVLPYAYSGGQALFDLNDPTRLISRTEGYFITPEAPYEVTSEFVPVCFLESMVRFHGQWLLIYGGGDKVICAAVSDQPGFEDQP